MTALVVRRADGAYRPDGRIKLSADETTVTSMPSHNSASVIFMIDTSTAR